VHCVSEVQAHQLVAAIAERMEQAGLRLHPDKTKIVYCRTGHAAAPMSTRRSRFSASRSGSAGRGTSTEGTSTTSCPRSARRP
jgi:hypothetical protein